MAEQPKPIEYSLTSGPNSIQNVGKPRAVLLVGFMGAGKTTVGHELGRRVGCTFIDLDDVIVAKAGKSIAEIFATSGEPAFRALENQALRRVLSEVPERPTVIALGGGAFVQRDNIEVIRRSGIPTIFLDAGIDTLLMRCRAERKTRPLAQDENLFRQLYRDRRSAYMKADYRVETARKAVREIVSEILSRLGWSNEVSGVPQEF
jgi:shikimate kinase